MGKRTFLLAVAGLCFLISALPAQQRHWVYFTDRGADVRQQLRAASADALGISEQALARRYRATGERSLRIEDLPPAAEYLRAVESTGAEVFVTSRWFNAVSVLADTDQLERIAALPAVLRIEPVRSYRPDVPRIEALPRTPMSLSSYGLDYGFSLNQMEMIRVPLVHDVWIDGSHIIIGMLDNGYRWRAHQALRTRDIRSEYDFINDDSLTENESGEPYGQDAHGTSTFSAMGGFFPGTLIGPAFNAAFLLAKTEVNNSETQIEEDYWVQGIEWLEAQGASVVSASLGYSTWDDGTGYRYENGDFDGKTAVTTRAAIEAMRRGVLLVTAMGNSGSAPGSLIAPADADSIIAVGAVNYDNRIAGFSSRGPTNDARVKPDVVAPGVSVFCATKLDTASYQNASGTSMATPLTAGVAAMVRSLRPELTPVEVRDALRATADNATSPDNIKGWGLIDAFEAILYHGMAISTNPKVFWSGPDGTVMAWVVSKHTVDESGVTLSYQRAGGDRNTVQMTKIEDYPGIGPGSGLYLAHISSIPEGTEVRFSIHASDSRETRSSPAEAPARLHRVIAGENRMLGAEHLLPNDFALEQNYPNPFVPSEMSMTSIRFSVPMPGAHVQLRLHDLAGRVVRTLLDDFRGPGPHSVSFSDTDLATGVYIYRLTSGGQQLMRRMIIMK
ncbi:MAG: S8 family peptidase [Bacteroidetes bacterium]|nr:S8 family peptidase [Bacteroidota bacterium]